MQGSHSTAAKYFYFEFVKKRTSLQHRHRQTIPLKFRQLQGGTRVLLLVDEALLLPETVSTIQPGKEDEEK